MDSESQQSALEQVGTVERREVAHDEKTLPSSEEVEEPGQDHADAQNSTVEKNPFETSWIPDEAEELAQLQARVVETDKTHETDEAEITPIVEESAVAKEHYHRIPEHQDADESFARVERPNEIEVPEPTSIMEPRQIQFVPKEEITSPDKEVDETDTDRPTVILERFDLEQEGPLDAEDVVESAIGEALNEPVGTIESYQEAEGGPKEVKVVSPDRSDWTVSLVREQAIEPQTVEFINQISEAVEQLDENQQETSQQLFEEIATTVVEVQVTESDGSLAIENEEEGEKEIVKKTSELFELLKIDYTEEDITKFVNFLIIQRDNLESESSADLTADKFQEAGTRESKDSSYLNVFVQLLKKMPLHFKLGRLTLRLAKQAV